ncbi:hypothetical protein PCASD_23489 [Puccinia coronata f. sp. avenae]|uniref:Uncharacterized protein n=1 Tax=Puccinia coronata f. sp. avenae TaxID=200324 RepID=A0A2N5TNM3_9BASI|nr:hypothetical protein PCASD_23489 [Puccinia coronata f. sp. avenae]
MVAAHIPRLQIPRQGNQSSQRTANTQRGSTHKRPRCQSTPPPSDSDPEDNNRHEDPDSDNIGGSAPQHRDPQVDPEIETLDQRSRETHDNGSGGNILVDRCPPQAPSILEEGIRKLRAMTALDDHGFNRAVDIIRTPGAPIHFLVMREMERVILGESERLNRPANTEPANRPVNPKPATPARFIFSAVTKERIRSLTKKAFLRHDIDSYTRGSFKDGTRDKSLLTITMQGLERLPDSTQEREFPPGYLHADPAARKALLAQVREIQKRVRLSIREKLLTNMLDADGNTIEDQIVPNVH